MGIIVTCNEMTISNAMEMEGFKRALVHLEKNGIKAEHNVTDRHASIRKFLRTERPDMTYYFDFWHVAKGMNVICVTAQLQWLSPGYLKCALQMKSI